MYIELNFVELFSLNLGIIFKGVNMQFEGTMNIENKNSIASFWNYTVNMILGVLWKSHNTMQSSQISNAQTNSSKSGRPLRKVWRVCSDNQIYERPFLQRNKISEEKSTTSTKACS